MDHSPIQVFNCRDEMSSWSRRAACAIICLLCGVHGAAAEPNTETLTVVEAFVSRCLALLPDTRKVEILAKLEKWETLPPDLAPLVAPADPNSSWQGWFLRDKQLIVGISTGTNVGGEPVNTCVLSGLKGDHRDAINPLLKFHTDLKILDENTEAGQHVITYSGSLLGYPLAILVAGPIEGPGMTISGVVIER